MAKYPQAALDGTKLMLMAAAILLLFGELVSAQGTAQRLVAPAPTVRRLDYSFDGWSPKITPGMGGLFSPAMDVVARQASGGSDIVYQTFSTLTLQNCGYFTVTQALSFFQCAIPATCIYLQPANVIGCGNGDSSNFLGLTSCVDYDSISNCDSSCMSDPLVAKCNSAAPACITLSYVGYSGYQGSTPTGAACGTLGGNFIASNVVTYSGSTYSVSLPIPTVTVGLPSTIPTSTSLASTSTATSTPPHTSHVGAIAGGVVGGVIGLFLVAGLLLLYCYKRRQRRNRNDSASGSPNAVQPNQVSGPHQQHRNDDMRRFQNMSNSSPHYGAEGEFQAPLGGETSLQSQQFELPGTPRSPVISNRNPEFPADKPTFHELQSSETGHMPEVMGSPGRHADTSRQNVDPADLADQDEYETPGW